MGSLLNLNLALEDLVGNLAPTQLPYFSEAFKGSHEPRSLPIGGTIPAVVHDGLLGPLSLEEFLEGRPLEQLGANRVLENPLYPILVSRSKNP